MLKTGDIEEFIYKINSKLYRLDGGIILKLSNDNLQYYYDKLHEYYYDEKWTSRYDFMY